MVALLKSGRINNRLLCELATHKDFIKFLADIEVYVDGIASMQIQNLNSLVDTVRHEIIERYRPGEDDPYLRILQAAHIECSQLNTASTKPLLHGNIHHATAVFLFPFLSLADIAFEEFGLFKDMYKLPELRINFYLILLYQQFRFLSPHRF